MNTKRNWAERAKRKGYTLPEGFVNIGTGNEASPLADFFGGQHNIYKIKQYNSTPRNPNVKRASLGNKPNHHYAVLVEIWEKYTGLNYKETIKEMKNTKPTGFFTKYSPGLEILVKEILERKGIEYRNYREDGLPNFIFYNGAMEVPYVSEYTGTSRAFSNRFYEDEISPGDFIKKIEAFAEKPKEFRTSLGGFETIVKADQVSVGCQTYPKPVFEMIERAVNAKREASIIRVEGLQDVEILNDRIVSKGNVFSFEQFDIINAEFKKLQ